MGMTFWLFAALAVILAGLTWLAAGAGARYGVRASAVMAMVLALGLGFVAIAELLGRPKPIEQAWLERNKKSARILAIKLNKDEGIYFWLLFPGETVPRAYSLPWSRRTAEQVDDAMNKATTRNHRLEIEGPMSKLSSYGDGELPIRIIAPPTPRTKTLPNRPRTVEPGKTPI